RGVEKPGGPAGGDERAHYGGGGRDPSGARVPAGVRAGDDSGGPTVAPGTSRSGGRTGPTGRADSPPPPGAPRPPARGGTKTPYLLTWWSCTQGLGHLPDHKGGPSAVRAHGCLGEGYRSWPAPVGVRGASAVLAGWQGGP